MAKKKRSGATSDPRRRPTDGELPILEVLWARGSATVREVFNELSSRREVGYTTVLKLMQIMAEKGLVERDESVRPQVYRPLATRKQTQRQAMSDLVERLFGGSPGKLVLQALSSERATGEELEKIRQLLDRLESDSGPKSREEEA